MAGNFFASSEKKAIYAYVHACNDTYCPITGMTHYYCPITLSYKYWNQDSW